MSEFKCPHCGEPIRADKAAPTRASAEQNKNAQKPSAADPEYVKRVIPKDMQDSVEVWAEGDVVKVKAKRWLGQPAFKELSGVLKGEFKAEWVSDGKNSHWRIG